MSLTFSTSPLDIIKSPVSFSEDLRELPINHDSPRGFAEDFGPIVDNEEMFIVFVNVSYFKPENLTVKIEGPFLCLEAVQVTDDNTNYAKRSCTRRWTLPPNVIAHNIKSFLTEDGGLTVKCPKWEKEFFKVPIKQV